MSEASVLRYEFKLACDGQWLDQARTWVRLHRAGLRVAFPPRRVNSLYLDTPRLDCLQANLDGHAARRKLRWRWYGEDLSRAAPVFLESKDRHGLLSAKAQVPLSSTLDMTSPWREILEGIRAGAPGTWQETLLVASQPVLLISYWREYYVTPDAQIRVTLDMDLAAFDQRFGLRPNLRVPLPLTDLVVIEVKADRAYAEGVREIVSGFPIPRTRNSKYAQGMVAALYAQ